MIPINFDYYLPNTTQEALLAYTNITQNNKTAIYYSGGSEVISMCRTGSIKPDAIIDLKNIPECQELKIAENNLLIGSCVTLTKLKSSKLFPLMGTTVGRIADHTNQTRITVGGNVCGTIIYKESVLPLLLTDATVNTYSIEGNKSVSIHEIFNKRVNLKPSVFITSFLVDTKFCNTKYFHIKKTANEKIDYPLITVCTLNFEGKIRIAFSGLCEFPFRSLDIEETLNDINLSKNTKLDIILSQIPGKILDNLDGSADYRMFVLRNTLDKIIS